MATINENRTIQVRVKEGSALERLLEESKIKTISGALHEIAASYATMKDEQEARRGDR